jgi:hypothetical protein
VHRPRCRSRGGVALQRVRPTVGRALHDTHKLHRESTLRFDASARADWWRPASAHLPHRFPTATTGCSRVLWDEAIRTLPAVWTCPCLNPSTPSSGQRRALWQYIFHGKLGRHRRGTVRTLLSDKNARICLASLTLIHVTKFLADKSEPRGDFAGHRIPLDLAGERHRPSARPIGKVRLPSYHAFGACRPISIRRSWLKSSNPCLYQAVEPSQLRWSTVSVTTIIPLPRNHS